MRAAGKESKTSVKEGIWGMRARTTTRAREREVRQEVGKPQMDKSRCYVISRIVFRGGTGRGGRLVPSSRISPLFAALQVEPEFRLKMPNACTLCCNRMHIYICPCHAAMSAAIIPFAFANDFLQLRRILIVASLPTVHHHHPVLHPPVSSFARVSLREPPFSPLEPSTA